MSFEHGLLALNAIRDPFDDEQYIVGAPIRITYETSHTEPLHPDPTVVARMFEIALSNCEHGCKVYADPKSAVRVLGHNSNYGCRK